MFAVVIPRAKLRDIVFGLSGTLFSHFVRVTPAVFFYTKHMKAGCLECVMGNRFSLPPPPPKIKEEKFSVMGL